MFTGIIEETGTVQARLPRAAGARLRIGCSTVVERAEPGSSIAVNGVCLTAVEFGPGWFTADLAPETLERTNLGDLQPAALVNLERPLRAGAPLDGHIVQGHVDGTGTLESLDELGDGNWWLRVRLSAELERYLVFKGSVALDGISLTIARLEPSLVAATIIPHTYRHTNLRARRPGDRVNIECDILAKYVEKLLNFAVPARSPRPPAGPQPPPPSEN
jgi:riboflavin synthase